MEIKFYNRFWILLSGFLCLCFFTSIEGKAQIKKKVHHSFKVKKKLREANDFFEIDDFKSAESLYLSIWPLDSLNERVNLNIAICKYKLKHRPEEILPYLLKAEKKQALPEAQYYLGKIYHLSCLFDEASDHFTLYKSFPEDLREHSNEDVNRCIEMTTNAKLAKQQPHKAVIKNIGPTINTPFPEYVPLITADENILFFTSRREGSIGEQTDVLGNYHEDVYVSHKQNGNWTFPENLGSPVNTGTHDACVSISLDAQQMIMFRTSEDLTSGDLYLTNWDGASWSIPSKLGPEINSTAKELSACSNTDNSMIIFSSDRPGGYGGKDLYRVVTLPNGNWSQPQNLGNKINTKYDEDAPFISTNGQLLYFSSNGWNTIGGYDIFKAEFFPDFSFGEPQNLGYPINTVGDDCFFVVSADEKHGYYSSLNEDISDKNYLSQDIFLIDMRYCEDEMKIRKGLCLFENNNVPEQVQITVYDEVTNNLIGVYKPRLQDGRFIFIVNPYDSYKIIAEAAGYKTIEAKFKAMAELDDSVETEEQILTLDFKKIDN